MDFGLTWRSVTSAELEECLSIKPAAIGEEFVGRDRAFGAWRTLLGSRSFNSALVESKYSIGGHRILGFGASVFVSGAFAAKEIATPQPGLNARIMASIASNHSVVLGEDELKYENTYGGLHVVFLFGAWRKDILTPEQGTNVESTIAFSCLITHQGCRLCQALREAVDASDVEHLRAQRVFGSVASFDCFHAQNPTNGWNRDRALGISDRADAIAVPGSVPAMLFSHCEPVLRFRDEQQQLLIAALGGTTDDELVGMLNLKLATIKKRWASIFQRIAEVSPDLLPGFDECFERVTRGPQKKHHLLAYLREHPEELRPTLRSLSGVRSDRVEQARH